MSNDITIKIDDEFKNLIRPLKYKEYLQLEENIRNDGCLEPIVLWNDTIVDGHNRYEICTKNNIPFNVRYVDFSCREEAISWICKNQLGRRNISEETRRYLIGRQYESEKFILKIKNPNGNNQYQINSQDTVHHRNIKYTESPSRHKTAQRIADENHVTHSTVQKYAIYTRALDAISQKEPELSRKILSGNYKISHENIVELSRLSEKELKKINERVERNNVPYMQYSKTRKAIRDSSYDSSPQQLITRTPSIKDMPEFDPDSTVIELSLTVPTWTSSINRMKTNTNFEIVSDAAKERLEDVLLDLYSLIETILVKLKEE